MSKFERSKKLVVLFDGTWCGRETGTETNVSLIAKAIGIPASIAPTDTEPLTYEDPSRSLKACYFPGIGLGGTFLDYLFDGATANTIGEECMKGYQYIVENFDDDTDIWMFGLSRGSYTVRCIGGMINNCGIVKPLLTTDSTRRLVEEVYAIYRSPYDEDKPSHPSMQTFRAKASWQVNSPIAFLGIIDTVGSLGIPRLNAQAGGFDYPEFFSQDVSASVRRVYHACSMHDRLWAFQPCRARRSATFEHKDDSDFSINERWFPGCHYDLGRQKFRFFRTGVNIVEKLLFSLPNALTTPVIPNAVCADLVLHWLFSSIAANDPANQILQRGARASLTALETSMRGELTQGSGDVYGDMGKYAPAGFIGTAVSKMTSRASELANSWMPNLQLVPAIQSFLGAKTILNILLATRDRRIQDVDAELVDLQAPNALLGGVTPWAKGGLERYQSETVRKWLLVRDIVRVD
ncbi:hypothetical protein BT63DRAFT_228228 [Microthyrium microscopicum]|uniref:T6SS Phospholipase effector Tle1-like catalytic domain-containing protein n=1 Tax=Microthyrium microscopicum TaxID=703497 RepID=A0A6A6UD06_9PEZI|nr:hypothetical protein BT63DRAFT_228228 [Microthyrium microscopicum]